MNVIIAFLAQREKPEKFRPEFLRPFPSLLNDMITFIHSFVLIFFVLK